MTGLSRGGTERIRTSDTRFRKPLLYPLSYGPEHPKYIQSSVATQTPAAGVLYYAVINSLLIKDAGTANCLRHREPCLP